MKLLGFVIVIGTSIFSASASAADAVKVAPPQQKLLSSSNGRYVFGQISEFRRDQYMLDTQTGRLWQTACAKTDAGVSNTQDNCTIILRPVPYIGPGDDKWSVSPR